MIAKRSFTAALLATIALPAIAFADGDAPNFGNCAPTGEAGSISLTTVEPDTLIVATVLPNPGWWNGTSPEDTMDGFEYCLAANIAHRAGLKHMKLMNLAWDQFIGGAATGYDIAMASASATDKRREVFDFSQNYFSANLGVATKTGADVTAENLKDKRIGVLQGNLGADWVINTLKPSVEVSQYQGQPEMIAALMADQVDAIMTDTTLLLFSSVVVVSDRTVIDTQLQEAIFAFERTQGVVETITSESGAKSGQLAKALAGGKKIVVCTIQTFPFALKAVQELAATTGKKFAMIADEAHSSQTGEAASKLKQVLAADGQDEDISTEDILAAQMTAKAGSAGISFVAFTATPKAKTMELFGRPPNPNAPAGPDNLPAPFHVYSMRQAIEEGFILDVLKNYTPYALAFKLANDGKEFTDAEVEQSAALKSLMQWVKLHPWNISQKVAIVVEHYRSMVMPLLDGKAKAMVVVESRKEAVRWQLAMQTYIAGKGYPLGTLVAFSGEVNDAESGPDPFTETSKVLNPGLKGDIRETFKGQNFHVLIVANKFQTGFDQPLLCGMYIDRRLAGIQAVQTLSRLNRAYQSGGAVKDTTYILDFANSAEDILAAFKTYYETAELEAVTDPNQVLDLRAKLDALGYYDDVEVERVVKAELDPKATHASLSSAIEPVADRLLKTFKAARAAELAAKAKGEEKAATEAKETQEALIVFKSNMGAYLRLYAFLSQIFDYGSTSVEARSIFFRRLIPLLDFGREREGVDLSKVVLTHHKLSTQGKKDLTLDGGGEKLKPMTEAGSGGVQDKEKALLSQILQKLNDLFTGDLSDNDQLSYAMTVKGKLLDNQVLVQQAANNLKEQFSTSPALTKAVLAAIMDAFETHAAMSKQALDSLVVQEGLKDALLGPGQLYEALRERAA